MANPSSWPAGMRNNNPGNIKYNSGITWQGQVGPSQNTDQGDPQVVFSSQDAGMRALVKNIEAKANKGVDTIQELIAGSGGWTPGYQPGANGVASAAGIPVGQQIDLKDPDTLQKVVRGIVTQEHGPASSYYTDDMISSGINAALGYADTSSPTNAAAAAINKAAPVPATRVMVAPAKPASLPFGLGNIMSAAKNGLAAVQGIAADPAVRAGVQQGVMTSPGLMAQVMASPALRNQAFNELMAKNIGAAPTVQQGWNNNPNGTQAYAVSNAGQKPVTLVQSAGQVRSDAQMPSPGNQNMAVYRANREAVGGPITQQSIDQALSRNAVLFALANNGGGGGGQALNGMSDANHSITSDW